MILDIFVFDFEDFGLLVNLGREVGLGVEKKGKR